MKDTIRYCFSFSLFNLIIVGARPAMVTIRGVQKINMSKVGLADYLNPFSMISSSQKYQNFVCRIMGSAAPGIGHFGQNSVFWSKIVILNFFW